jgi:hypothetical protein
LGRDIQYRLDFGRKLLLVPSEIDTWMTISTDSQGRLYLSADLREQYGEKFHVIEYEDRIELVPIDDDPLQAVRDEIGDALTEESLTDLRANALSRAKQEAIQDLQHAPSDAEESTE